MVRLKEINGNRFDEVKVYKQETEAKRERETKEEREWDGNHPVDHTK